MAQDDFFQEPAEQTEETPAEGIKVGEKEYTQDELQALVGLGEQAREVETKFSTKLDKVFPEYTKASQERAKLRLENDELKAKLNPAPEQTIQPGGLTADQKAEAIRQLKDLGFMPKEEAVQLVRGELQAKELLAEVDSVIGSSKEAGNPATNRDDLLQHMAETGIKSPQKAYKDLFEKELDEIKEKKLSSIKRNGMVTTEESTAGSKNPAPIKVTKSNLVQLINEGLTSFRGE